LEGKEHPEPNRKTMIIFPSETPPKIRFFIYRIIAAPPAKKRAKNNYDGLVMGKIHYYYSHKMLGIAIELGENLFFRVVTNESESVCFSKFRM
jgi:hypothetical protein